MNGYFRKLAADPAFGEYIFWPLNTADIITIESWAKGMPFASLFNLNSAVGVDAGMQDIEMKRLEGGVGLIDKVIRTSRMNVFALKRLRHLRRIQLRNLGLRKKDFRFSSDPRRLSLYSLTAGRVFGGPRQIVSV